MLLERGYDSCPLASDVCTEVMDMLGEDRDRDSHDAHRGGGAARNTLAPVNFKRMVDSGQASTVRTISSTRCIPHECNICILMSLPLFF